MSSHPEQTKSVQYMFSMDMTGEDVAKTGGTFLIEKQADPSAVWARPSGVAITRLMKAIEMRSRSVICLSFFR